MAIPAAAATSGVTIADNVYQPHTITITVGDTVKWTDTGNNPHSVTANTGQAESFDSGPNCNAYTGGCLSKGQTFQHTFTHAGTFTYYCRVHGRPGDTTCPMCGTIVVRTAATGRPTVRPTARPTAPRPAVVRTPVPTPKPSASPTPPPTPPPTVAPAPSVSPLAAPPSGKKSNRGLIVGLAIAAAAVAASGGAIASFRLRRRV